MRLFLVSVLISLLSALCWANPSGPVVSHGQVQMSGSSQLQVQQLTPKAIINWQSFSIGNGESVQFLQPGRSSVVLNRVVGQDPSAILGQLRANGQVFLINPRGILFGPNSTVDVGGLVASSLNITDQDFLNSNYAFKADAPQTLGSVINQGTITFDQGGFFVLAGSTVSNEGVILARSGSLSLNSGQQSTINLDANDLVHFAVPDAFQEEVILLAPGALSQTLAGSLGVPARVISNELILLPDGTPRLVNSTNSAQILAQTTGQIVINVTLNPLIETTQDNQPDARPDVFAQNNTGLIEEIILLVFDPGVFQQPMDPTIVPPITDEDFQRYKFRR